MNGQKIFDGINQAIGYTKGWNEALEAAKNVALALDSNRGNEKEIAIGIDRMKAKENTNVK